MRGSDQALVATLSRQIEVVERQSDILSAHFQRAVEKEEAKSNKFAKLPNPVQNMIRMASSTDGERPSDPSGVSLDFYNAESEGRADTIFMQAMRDLSSGTVAVSQAVTSALYQGFFLYNNGMTPSNLSVFNFTLQTPGTSDATRGEVVHLIATQGKRKTENEIKASMQQCIKIPADFDGMMRQIRFFKDAAIILLGKNSKLADELGRLLKSIGREEQTFRLRIHGDEMYISKFLYAIDVRCQRHLSECRDARDREEDVRDRTIEFDDLTEQVAMGTFEISLPHFFEKAKKEDHLNNPRKDRKRHEDQTPGQRVENNDQPEEFKMKPNED